VLAARSAIIMVAAPLGTAAGGPIVGTFGAAQTLTASGAATVLLAVTTGVIWARKKPPTGETVMAPTEAAAPAPPSCRDTITHVSLR
jgi:hypothetical protein